MPNGLADAVRKVLASYRDNTLPYRRAMISPEAYRKYLLDLAPVVRFERDVEVFVEILDRHQSYIELNGPADRAAVEQIISEAYVAAELVTPQKFVWMPSPADAALCQRLAFGRGRDR